MPASDKLLAILQIFTEEDRPVWTAEEIAGAIGLSASTAYRYLKSLVAADLLDQASGGYVIGPGVVALYRHLQLHDPILRAARPVMIELAANAGPRSTVILCRLFRDQVMCVHQELQFGPQEPVGYEIGRPRPMFRGSASKVILAHLSTRTQKKLYADHTQEVRAAGLGMSWEAFRANLKEIRKQPALVSRGELDPGRVGVASPLIAPNGAVIGSLSTVLTAEMASEPLVGRVAVALVAAAHVITQSLAAAPGQERQPVSLAAYEPRRRRSVP